MRNQFRLTNRQVNLFLEVLVIVALVSGLVSWIVPLDSARLITVVHSVAGLSIVVVAPIKIRGPVRTGIRRHRRTRWISAGFGVLVLSTIALGVAHTTGLWFGVGYWSALWTHQLFGFAIIPLLVWHVLSRPVKPSTVDHDRRGLLTAGAVGFVALAAVGAQELTLRGTGLAGGSREGTGSHDTGSFDPKAMPTVQWIDDTAPESVDPDTWSLLIAGKATPIEQLWSVSQSVTARLDCTGGWYADQHWDAVSLRTLLGDDTAGRSVRITSSTGYARLFPLDAIDDIYLAVGYGGVPLGRGHGAPVRVVAPNRRGPQWVKWVTDVSIMDRPAWLQLPLPPT